MNIRNWGSLLVILEADYYNWFAEKFPKLTISSTNMNNTKRGTFRKLLRIYKSYVNCT